MLLSALSTDISCLNLTDGLHPDKHVLAKAEGDAGTGPKGRLRCSGSGGDVRRTCRPCRTMDTNKLDMVAKMVHRNVDMTKAWGNLKNTKTRVASSLVLLDFQLFTFVLFAPALTTSSRGYQGPLIGPCFRQAW